MVMTTVVIHEVTSQYILGRPGIDNDMEILGAGDS